MHLHGNRARVLVTALLLFGLMIAVLPAASRPYWKSTFVNLTYQTSSTAITIDSQGKPVIAYFLRQQPPAVTDPVLVFTKFSNPGSCNCIFNDFTGDTDMTSGVALALDASDKPRIAYHDGHLNELQFFYPDGLTYRIKGSGINGIYPSMVLDDQEDAWISFYDQDTGDLDYAHLGSDLVWNIFTIAQSIEPTWSSIVVSSSGEPFISYYDSNAKQLKVVGYPSSANPNEVVVDNTAGAGVYSSLKLDSNGALHLAYWDSTNQQLKYASSADGSAWTIEVVQDNVTIGTSVSLAIDPDDHPHMSYLNVVEATLQYASYDGSAWTIMNITPSTFTGDIPNAFSSLAIDSNGNPYIAYLENNAQVLELATLADDSTSPTISGAPTTTANSNGWYNHNVVIHWTCADDGGAGLKSCEPDSTITSEGTGLQVTGTAEDNAGNTSTATSSPAVNIDKSDPTIIGGPADAPNANGWYTSPVPIEWNCDDALSGIDTCTEDSTLSTEGANQSVSGTAVDKAGNSAQTSATVSLDLSGPTLSGAPTESPNANGWFNSPVTITWDCSDDVSGITACQDDQTVSSDGANQTTSGSATNGAGMTATAVSEPFSIDQVKPGISGTPTGDIGMNGWYTGPVTIEWECDDALSQIDSCPTDQTISTDGTDQYVSGTATDKAGNTQTANSSPVDIDQTPPVVTFTGNQGTYTLDQTVDIHCTASDALSGLASSTCVDISGPASSFVTGANTFAASATDNAGNVGTASTTFTVDVTVSGLCALTREYVNNQRLGNQLCAPLTLAQLGETLHNPRLTRSALNMYILLVSTQRGRALTFTEANTLIMLARSLSQ